jgi:DNA mismatch repair protein MutS2
VQVLHPTQRGGLCSTRGADRDQCRLVIPIGYSKEKTKSFPSIPIGDGIKVLIISGANAGGKTVALKTLGLLTSMVQCGLPIPVAEGSRVSIFRKVFALIGDEQNIEENLSTFSSNLLHLNQIAREVSPRSLVLLDELGVGTHASEGCALAMGFLDQLRETGATVAVTTHFDGLKTYGYLHRMFRMWREFDEKTWNPSINSLTDHLG